MDLRIAEPDGTRERRKLRDGDSSYETGEGKMTREEINHGIEHARALHPMRANRFARFFPPFGRRIGLSSSIFFPRNA